MPRLDFARLVKYAQRLGPAIARRAGWVLEQQGYEAPQLDELAAFPVKGYRKLDPTGPREGAYNHRWMLQENLPGDDGHMRPLRIRLQQAWRRLGLQSYVVERDYLLSWVLAGISAVPELRETLVFKGGTALKKCYFGDYRFSEDLDFSGLEGVPTGDDLAEAILRACDEARALLVEYAQVDLQCERHVENNPHPGGQEAFRIRARLPWHPLTGYPDQSRNHRR